MAAEAPFDVLKNLLVIFVFQRLHELKKVQNLRSETKQVVNEPNRNSLIIDDEKPFPA